MSPRDEPGRPARCQRGKGGQGRQNIISQKYTTQPTRSACWNPLLDVLFDAAADAAVLAVELAELAHQRDDGAITVRALDAARLAVDVYQVYDVLARAAQRAGDRQVLS